MTDDVQMLINQMEYIARKLRDEYHITVSITVECE